MAINDVKHKAKKKPQTVKGNNISFIHCMENGSE
jgi:hypothetical protein